MQCPEDVPFLIQSPRPDKYKAGNQASDHEPPDVHSGWCCCTLCTQPWSLTSPCEDLPLRGRLSFGKSKHNGCRHSSVGHLFGRSTMNNSFCHSAPGLDPRAPGMCYSYKYVSLFQSCTFVSSFTNTNYPRAPTLSLLPPREAVPQSNRQNGFPSSSPVRLCLRYCDDVWLSRCLHDWFAGPLLTA